MSANIRNFCISSHIDHGKSTLADRFLEITKSVDAKKMRPQFLDSMDLERERGITIKMTPVRMEYQDYVLNMIDTPGHVDFSYEVSRSLAAIEGVVLLVDISKGIQAQTLINLEMAKKENLTIIPVLNKIDLIGHSESGKIFIDQERVDKVAKELAQLVGAGEKEILKISAKNGINVEKVLEAVIQKVPAPKTDLQSPFKALIFDFEYDHYKGVIAYIRVIEGELKKGEQIFLLNAGHAGQIKEIGSFRPEPVVQEVLQSGEIGYAVLGIREPDKVKIGDTVTPLQYLEKVRPLPGYKEPKPVVFVGLFPQDPNNWGLLKEGLSRLKLKDPALSFKPESKSSLGRGFYCGFLGLLHAEIVIERLKREYGLNLISSSPSVCYRMVDKDDNVKEVCSVIDWPDPSVIKKSQEQYCFLRIIVPVQYLGKVLELVEERSPRVRQLSLDKSLVECYLPFREIMANFYDKLKSATQGYGSMDYKFSHWQETKLAKLEILIASKPEPALSKIVPSEDAYKEGKELVERLEQVFPLQQFNVPLQAAIGGKIIARRTVKARRKDVTGALYGGDYTRKKKLLEKQKKGKKRLQDKGKIRVPQEVIWKVFRSE
jgi:GTP-binding protein LepA